jgi:acetyl-CoA carboxylase biotin carboxylase subunit
LASGDVYLEKYVEAPRHIEIQVLGDHHGNVVHLGERECSIQRRHQKLIEEAPSVALTEKQRKRLGATGGGRGPCGAVHESRDLRVPDGSRGDISTSWKRTPAFRSSIRSPSSSPGIDIVKEQIRIAAGQRLSVKQGDIEFRGHAMECRINAEDPGDVCAEPGRD